MHPRLSRGPRVAGGRATSGHHSLFHVAARNGVVVGCGEPPLGSSVTAVTAIRRPAGIATDVNARPLESVLKVPRLTGALPVSIPHNWYVRPFAAGGNELAAITIRPARRSRKYLADGAGPLPLTVTACTSGATSDATSESRCAKIDPAESIVSRAEASACSAAMRALRSRRPS